MSKRILITGINGFIGKSLKLFLESKGYDVWGTSRSVLEDKTIKIDLSKNNFLTKNNFPCFDIIIHSAASSSEYGLDNERIFIDNISIIKNTLDYFSKKNTHNIFLSSISIYGEDQRNKPVKIDDYLNPSSYYGKSKLQCEIVIKNRCNKYNILRLAPVYNKNEFSDISKRIIFPLLKSFVMIIKPSPTFSFCSLELVSKAVHICIKDESENNIYNINDNINYSQNDIASVFDGKTIVIYEVWFKLFYWSTYLFGKNRGYLIRCLYWKIFKTNVYKNNMISLIEIINENDNLIHSLSNFKKRV
jgi:nucleoside-diphosphate-sugar epimerase